MKLNKIISIFIIIFFIQISTNFPILADENEKIEGFNEIRYSIKLVELNDFSYKLFYIGRITNLERTDDTVSFDGINIYRISRIKSSDGSFWEFSINHYKNIFHSLKDYRFQGIITEKFILGTFSK
jgi:hypothetical protein